MHWIFQGIFLFSEIFLQYIDFRKTVDALNNWTTENFLKNKIVNLFGVTKLFIESILYFKKGFKTF